MEFNAELILVYALMLCFMVLVFMTRKDAFRSVSRMGEILHEAQSDAKEREEDIWKRANVELQVKNQQLVEAHKMLLKTKIPMVQQTPFPFQQPATAAPNSRPRTPSRMPDQATMG